MTTLPGWRLFPSDLYPHQMSIISDLGIPAIDKDLSRVEEALRSSVRTDNPFLTEVASHLIDAGGKRLRPVLALCAGYAKPGVGTTASADDPVIAGAISAELVHLGSLYHDDVIDEAATRRGVPSVNARWNNIVAILTGDFLLARASEIATSLGADVAGLLAGTIGELCKGQMLELQYLFNIERDTESYYSAIAGKTAALMASSCRIGAMAAELPDPAIEALASFGHHVGMVFQIVDDVLDMTADEEELGKPTCNDLVEGIYTLPVIEVLAESEELRALLGRRLSIEEAADARDVVVALGGTTIALEAAETHAERARTALEHTELDSDAVESLCRLPGLILSRAQSST